MSLIIRRDGFGVYFGFREFGELRVSFFFLVECFFEQLGEIIVTESDREGAGGAVAGDFIMLNALRCAD